MTRAMTPTDPIAIVGAGPVGLVAALRLARLGIRSVVLEQQPALADDLRASTFHPPTLEMLDTLDLAAPLIDRGLVTPSWQIRMHETHERVEFHLDVLSDDTPYPFRLQCEQSKLCRLALDAATAEELIEVRFGAAVSDLRQQDDRVVLQVETDDGREEVAAPYAIAADGSKSTIRGLLDLQFEGLTYPETTILATTRFPFERHLPGLSNVNYVWMDGGTFSLLRLPDLWRCSLYADTGETIDQATEPARVEAKLQRIVGRDAPYDVMEVRPYRIHQRIVSDYRVGRVLLAGDAAHINSPSGGMGMNGGVHDAFNLTEKLARVIKDGADPGLLDLYTRQRLPIARDQILAQAHKNRTRMQERDADKRRAELDRLQTIAADPDERRAFLLRTSMIEGLRRAAAMT